MFFTRSLNLKIFQSLKEFLHWWEIYPIPLSYKARAKLWEFHEHALTFKLQVSELIVTNGYIEQNTIYYGRIYVEYETISALENITEHLC